MKHIMKKTTKWAGMALLSLATMAITVTSCNNDDEPNPDNNGQEKATAYVREIEIRTSNGYINYLDITDHLESDPDLSKAIEIGLNVNVNSVDGFPLTINSDAKTITKWSVDKTTLKLSVAGILSYASTGVTSNNMILVSGTSGFISDLTEGVIVEFNPTTMEIVKTHNVTPLDVPANFLSTNNGTIAGTIYNNRIIFPIQWSPDACCDYPTPVYATIGIFDPATGTLSYDTDERAIGLNPSVMIDGDDAYLVPSTPNSFIKKYLGASANSNLVFKLNADGTINDNFISDIKDGIPEITVTRSSFFVSQGKYIFLYAEDELPESFEDRYNVYWDFEYKSVSYDLNTHEVKPFTRFDEKGYSTVFLVGTVDGDKYFSARYDVDDDSFKTDLLLQNEVNDYSLLTTVNGGHIEYLGKLW